MPYQTNHSSEFSLGHEIIQSLTASNDLRYAEDTYRLLVDAVNDYAIYALDIDGNILTWNNGARHLKGYDAEEVIGTHFSIFYSQEEIDKKHPQFEMQEAIRNGSYQEEGWRIAKHGKKFWSYDVTTAVKDPQGKLLGFAKVTRDLTAKKHAEDEMRESEERFRLMVEGVRDYAIFMLDQKGVIVSWNEGARRNKGYEANEIIGQHFSVFYSEDDIKAAKPQMELQVASLTGRFEDTGWRIRKDGTKFWANVIITAIFNKNHDLIGFSKVTRNLTEKKIAEDKLKAAYENLEIRVLERTRDLEKAKEEAEQAVKARDEFLSIASHELKTPLTTFKLQIQMRKRRYEKGETQVLSPDRFKNMIEDDEKQINRINRLVDDMLDITRLNQGKLTIQPTELELSSLILEVLKRYSPQLVAANIPVEIETFQVNGFWDQLRLEQVFTNLLINAIKYGNGKRVHISVGYNDKWAILKVSDAGRGIAQEDQERIFKQFERAISASTVSGLGLGLYIVKQIIEAHAGTITVESELEKGSTFIVKLPLTQPHP